MFNFFETSEKQININEMISCERVINLWLFTMRVAKYTQLNSKNQTQNSSKLEKKNNQLWEKKDIQNSKNFPTSFLIDDHLCIFTHV